jgi:hypothetical protein
MNNELKTELRDEQVTTESVLTQLKLLEISTEADVEIANDLLGQAKADFKRLDDKRRTATQPLNAALHEINSWFKPLLSMYQQAESILKDKIAKAIAATQQAQDAALAQLAAAGGSTSAEMIVIAHGQKLLDAPKNITICKEWDFEILDSEKVPEQFWMLDMAKLHTAVKESKQDTQIPGIRVFSRDLVIRRTK